VDVLKACENAYILVEFIFRLVENSPRKRSQQTVVDHATEMVGWQKTKQNVLTHPLHHKKIQ
jgi:hypothetical protein